MSNFVPKKEHLREVLIHYFILKKTAAETYRILREAYGKYGLSQDTCGRWFKRFKSGNFDVNYKQHTGQLKIYENQQGKVKAPLLYQKKFKGSFNVSQQKIFARLQVMEKIGRNIQPKVNEIKMESLNVNVAPRKTTKRPAPVTEEDALQQEAKPIKRAKSIRVKTIKPEKDQENFDPQARLILREITSPGIVLTCGQGDVGQLGLGEDVLEKTRFSTIPNHVNIVAIAAGGMHNVCLTKEGRVLTFGCNDEGALGRTTSEEGSETIPAFVDLPGSVIQITAGDSHSAALLEDGRVFIWGSFRDSHGTMGLLTKDNERFPVQIPLKTKFIKIASGADHLVLLDRNKQVYTCGCGEQGQLGRLPERKTDRHNRQGVNQLLTPGQVHFKINKHVEVENIWAGTYATFIKDSHNGDIYVFGLNNYNQIGLKGTDKQFHPTISKTFSSHNWTHINSGQHHTIALDDKGKVFVLGRKEYGRLGLGSVESDAIELTAVPALEKIKCIDVAAGSSQSFAVSESGKLYAWGMGTSGQLGTGEEEDVDTPMLIDSKQLKDVQVIRVSGGGQHTIVFGLPAAINNVVG